MGTGNIFQIEGVIEEREMRRDVEELFRFFFVFTMISVPSDANKRLMGLSSLESKAKRRIPSHTLSTYVYRASSQKKKG